MSTQTAEKAPTALAELQDRADDLVPVGWCVPCLSNAMAAGEDPDGNLPVHAGVTTIAVTQLAEWNGRQQVVTVPGPVCTLHMGRAIRPPSRLATG